MPSFTADNAEILVFTYKEGLLSRVAHDLKLRVNDFELSVDVSDEERAERIRLRVNPRSLRVVCAMKNGRDNHRALSAGDVRDIEDNMTNEVLHPDRFDTITFESSELSDMGGGRRYQVRGELFLHGVRRSLWTMIETEADAFVAEARLHQPDFDIVPFSAMLGSMKIKPDVKVVVRVPKSAPRSARERAQG